MIRDDFYVTLPSDSSIKLFPENKTTHFIAQLPRHLTFKGNWCVALVEIEYPQTFSYIPNIEFEKNIWIYHGQRQYTIELPETIWKNVEEVVSYLQKNLEFTNHFNIFLSSDNFVSIEMARYEGEPCSRNEV